MLRHYATAALTYQKQARNFNTTTTADFRNHNLNVILRMFLFNLYNRNRSQYNKSF